MSHDCLGQKHLQRLYLPLTYLKQDSSQCSNLHWTGLRYSLGNIIRMYSLVSQLWSTISRWGSAWPCLYSSQSWRRGREVAVLIIPLKSYLPPSYSSCNCFRAFHLSYKWVWLFYLWHYLVPVDISRSGPSAAGSARHGTIAAWVHKRALWYGQVGESRARCWPLGDSCY